MHYIYALEELYLILELSFACICRDPRGWGHSSLSRYHGPCMHAVVVSKRSRDKCRYCEQLMNLSIYISTELRWWLARDQQWTFLFVHFWLSLRTYIYMHVDPNLSLNVVSLLMSQYNLATQLLPTSDITCIRKWSKLGGGYTFVW